MILSLTHSKAAFNLTNKDNKTPLAVLPTVKGILIWIVISKGLSLYSLTRKPVNSKNNGSCTTVIKRALEVPQTRINTGLLRPLDLFPLAPARSFLNIFAYGI